METVWLQRPSADVPWGFRLHGGRDYQTPLTVQKVRKIVNAIIIIIIITTIIIIIIITTIIIIIIITTIVVVVIISELIVRMLYNVPTNDCDMAVYDCVRLSRAVYDCVRLSKAMYGCVRLRTAV